MKDRLRVAVRVLFVLLTIYFCVACSDAGETPVPDQAERFGFSSGGADHLSGYGEWQIVLDREGLFGIVHKSGEDVRDLGGFPLTEAEAAEIWSLVQDVQKSSPA